MFLTHPQQTTDNFKENIKNLLDDCLNSQNKINIDKLPETLLVGDAAWLIIGTQYQGIEFLDNDEMFKHLTQEAERICRRIISRYYQGFEGFEPVDMSWDLEGKAHNNFTLTKTAFLEFINSNDKYRQLLKTKIQRKRSMIKDAALEALTIVILPELKKEKINFNKSISFSKLCWERLPGALEKIGCTNIKLNEKGSQDQSTVQATHDILNPLFITFKAFRQRIYRFPQDSLQD